MKPVNSSFTVLALTILFVILGCCSIPLFSIQRNPTDISKGLTVNFSWKGALAQVVERELTSKIEGLAAAIKGVKEITSTSSDGGGFLNIELDKHTNVKTAKFELTSLIRSAYKNFPEGVSLPSVSEKGTRSIKREGTQILAYTIMGGGSSYYIEKEAAAVFLEPLNDINDVYSAKLWVAVPYELRLIVNKKELESYGLTIGDVSSALNSYFKAAELGKSKHREVSGNYSTLFVELRGISKDDVVWEKIPLARRGSRVVYLGDIARVKYEEQPINSIKRFNGLNLVSLTISAREGANQVLLAKTVRERIESLKKELPPGFSLFLQKDSTISIKKEINTIVLRVVLSVLFLLLFTFIVSRSLKYLLLVAISLAVNLCIAFIFYYLLDIGIHTYSLAGITISLGIMIDNVIIMIDHLRSKGNMKIFVAILAATLTTVGSLSVIFFLGQDVRILLNDFAIIIVVNILTSLVVAFFVIPALLDVIPIQRKLNKISLRRKRWVVKWNHFYAYFINQSLRWKKLYLLLAILVFGIPIFLLPARINSNNWLAQTYNDIFQSSVYRKIGPMTEKILGGTLRLFVERDASGGRVPQQNAFGNLTPVDRANQATQLNVNITMPDGASVEELEGIAWKFENHLLQYNEVASFETSISNGENANIQAIIDDSSQRSFPHRLKNELIDLANNTGGCDVRINGVGKGFSNSLGNDILRTGITVSGYNYDAVLTYAEKTLEYLKRQPRVDKERVNTGQRMYAGKVRYEYEMNLQKDLLIKQGSSPQTMLTGLRDIAMNQQRVSIALYDGQYIPVKVYTEEKKGADNWLLNNSLQQTSRLGYVGTLEKKMSGGHITRRNQQYEVNVDYNFIGNYRLAKKVQEGIIDSVNVQLPIGFKAQSKNRGGFYSQVKGSQYKLIFLVIAIVFLLCCVLLESMRQAMVIVLMIPLSFIGIFLTFSLFGFNFDQGGYAAFLLISGLSVNAALYIFNDFNNNGLEGQSGIRQYLNAYNSKITPILLTVISTIVSFLPFLLTVPGELFWDALAAGTIGGLLFSIPILVVFLPLFLLWNSDVVKKDTTKTLSKLKRW
ncbi:efflux RND transporter permease subunit [Zhouia amylolytica]|uniref:Uncharacterized protein n=1 Tax=Zhouia amylolytica AD3 TaxID=1286632 RepID=W2UQF2_9FLAO|nr:efflux RND transporter permease subunit [Zhouia amylolytica]ETN96375.1 hypothetical protein P278_07190 [Zhouia amylolytica AD3]